MHPTSLLFGSEDYAFTHPAPIPVSEQPRHPDLSSSQYHAAFQNHPSGKGDPLSSPLRGAAGESCGRESGKRPVWVRGGELVTGSQMVEMKRTADTHLTHPSHLAR